MPKLNFMLPTKMGKWQIFCIFDDFSKFCSTFGALHFEKSSSIPPSFAENEENRVFRNTASLKFQETKTCKYVLWLASYHRSKSTTV